VSERDYVNGKELILTKTMKGEELVSEEFNLNKGENEVPTFLTVFLIGRKLANIL